MDIILAWLHAHSALLWSLSGLSVVLFIGSLAFIPVFVSRIPVDYFVRTRPSPPSSPGQRYLRWAGLLCAHLIGVVLVLAGIAMLVLPGQGILTILIGLSLIRFPGKRALELRLVRIPSVFRALNWIRHKAGRASLNLP